MATAHDLEKHDPTTVDVQSNKSPASMNGSNANQTPLTKDANTTKNIHLQNLITFQDLVGIRTPPHILFTGRTNTPVPVQPSELEKGQKNLVAGQPADTLVAKGRPTVSTKDFFFKKEVTNDGIYGRAIGEALAASIYFNLSNWFINALYCVQILIAAAITGLASYKGHEIPLTVLGAINTVLAGLMAFMKGQGLPVRMRRSRDQFQNVMKTIENTERMFSRYAYMQADDQKLHDPFKEFELCQGLYDAAKWDQQANYPDLYSNSHERAAVQLINDNNRTGGAIDPATLQKQIDDLTAKLEKATKQPTGDNSGIVRSSDQIATGRAVGS